MDDVTEFDGALCYLNLRADELYARLADEGIDCSRSVEEVGVEAFSKFDRTTFLKVMRYRVRGRIVGDVFFPTYGFSITDDQRREVFDTSHSCIRSLERSLGRAIAAQRLLWALSGVLALFIVACLTFFALLLSGCAILS